ncbi:hypothetical protein IL252_08325 [Halomicrobium sp. IBSBa]|uniref:hypothetical protein n=1 Tax=Halomicrobium sp. IBSBa TaxID=2778916 RepID=UPI001ABF80C5|nr:hypothetical protein [Halomicrobium sp. IBSBa]MBO4247819.1 hypothetical protein [Halomicrobium sp. IBSBa]
MVEGNQLVNIIAVLTIIGTAVVTDELLLGIIAVILLRILTVLVDLRRSLRQTDRPFAAGSE